MRDSRSVEYAKFALAESLCKTVAELEATMTVDEFNGWQAYYAVAEEKRRERD